MSSRTVYVHLGYGFGAAQYRERFRAGLVPDEVPYGFHHAESAEWHLTYSVDHPESAPARFLRRALNRVLGMDLIHAWRNRSLLFAADIAWTMEERQGLAILVLGLIHKAPPVILQIIWLLDQWPGFSAPRRWVLRMLLRRAARVTVHSRNYIPAAERLQLGIVPTLLPFGISGDSFPASAEPRGGHSPIRILAMGSDPTRDWTTFLLAFGSDPHFQVVAISPHLTPERTAGISNLTVPVNPTMQQFVDFYRWADLVVIPMVPNLYSGITVALEAARQGVPVLSAHTGGVPTYFAEGEVLYVPPSDPDALREAALACDDLLRAGLVRRAYARFNAEDYSTQGMAGRYVRLSEEILEGELHAPSRH